MQVAKIVTSERSKIMEKPRPTLPYGDSTRKPCRSSNETRQITLRW